MNECFSKFFQAISDNRRQQILTHLEEKPRCVSELVDLFQVSQSCISKHLSVLKNAGLVDARRCGQNVIYSLNQEKITSCCRDFFRNFECCSHMFTSEKSEIS
ncbi:MAG: winged helix-turn-helix transcriptional regulator [Actinomycetia bacterium]|nr:winged helix-turn-helix transcriptional regulator [Actinomycetes bacterium]